jgi:uncharacterized protein (TIGR02265 family)
MTVPDPRRYIPATRVERPLVPDAEKLFNSPLDTAVRAVEVAGLLTPATRAEIQARFGRQLGKPQCNCQVSNELIDLLCATCYADLPRAEALRVFGRYNLERFRETILGRVMMAAMPLMGLDRVMRRAPHDFAAACNYGTRATSELGRHHWLMEFEDEIVYPDVLQGMFE